MKPIIRQFFAGFLLTSLACAGEKPVTVVSPGQKYQLFLKTVPEPDDPNVPCTSASICDPRGKLIQQVFITNFPVIAIKWHKSAGAVMILEHIAQGELMELITLQNGVWKWIEVTPFKNTFGYFHLVDAKSAGSSFRCYYLGYDDTTEKYTAYCTEVSIATGEFRIKSAKRIKDEDLPFYKLSPDDILYQMGNVEDDNPLHFESWPSDNEPDWYGVRW